jgi:hypothetical protein
MSTPELEVIKNMQKAVKDMEKVEARTQETKKYAEDIKEAIRKEVENTEEKINVSNA